MVVEIDIESYKINKQKLFNLLKSIKDPGLKKHDMLKKIYIPAFENEITLEYYTWCVWEILLKDKSMIGTAINKYEWKNYFKEQTTNNNVLISLFNKINNKSKCISYEEFLNFFLMLDESNLVMFFNIIEQQEVQNPLIDVDLADTVIINIKPEQTNKNKQPNKEKSSINKETHTSDNILHTPPQNNKKPFNIDKDKQSYCDNRTNRANYCDRFYLMLLNIKLIFINVKNKIINKVYGFI
jgi:hypothetical protein